MCLLCKTELLVTLCWQIYWFVLNSYIVWLRLRGRTIIHCIHITLAIFFLNLPIFTESYSMSASRVIYKGFYNIMMAYFRTLIKILKSLKMAENLNFICKTNWLMISLNVIFFFRVKYVIFWQNWLKHQCITPNKI